MQKRINLEKEIYNAFLTDNTDWNYVSFLWKLYFNII